jgi:hypothetical protein
MLEDEMPAKAGELIHGSAENWADGESLELKTAHPEVQSTAETGDSSAVHLTMQGPVEVESSSQAWPERERSTQVGRNRTGRSQRIIRDVSCRLSAGRVEGSRFRESRG